MLRQISTLAREAFVQRPIFKTLFLTLITLISIGIVISFATLPWIEIDPGVFQDPGENEATALSAIAPLIGNPPADDTVKLSAWEIWRGSNARVPTLDLDKATRGANAVRFVDRFLVLIPLGVLIMLILAGLYGWGKLQSGTALVAILVISLGVFLVPYIWRAISNLDWLGYDQLQNLNRNDRSVAQDALKGFYNLDVHLWLGFLLIFVTVGASSTYFLAINGMLHSKPYTESARNLPELLRSKSLWWYLTSMTLLILSLIILDWFYPQAADSPTKFYNLTYQGIGDGALLALIALGLVLIYKASDVINFAHGELMMIGAYVFSELLVHYNFALTVGLIVAAAVMVLIGAFIERAFLRPLIGKPIISVIMVTIGLSNVIGAVVGAFWINQPQDWQERGTNLEEGFLPLLTRILPKDSGLYKELSTGAYQVFEEGRRLPYSFKYENVYLTGIVLVLIIFLGLLFKYSKQGVAMRATADDQQAALSMGISVKRIFAITWGMAALFAGIAGVLLGDIGTGATIDVPTKGLRAFPVIILGGLDSIAGAIIGGLIIGLLENYAVGYVDPMIKAEIPAIVPAASTKDIIPYLVLITILMFRPYGLFGKEVIERV